MVVWWLCRMFLFVCNASWGIREWQAMRWARHFQRLLPTPKWTTTASPLLKRTDFTAPSPPHALPIFWNWGPEIKYKSMREGVGEVCVSGCKYWVLAFFICHLAEVCVCATLSKSPNCPPYKTVTILASREAAKGRVVHSIIIIVRIWIYKMPNIWRTVK